MRGRSFQGATGATLAAAVLFGCAGNPQTPDEFRKTVPGSMTGKLVTFEAARPFREVAKTFQARGPECLNVRIRQYHQTGTASWMTNAVYKPTVLVTDRRAELHLQMHYDGQMVIGEEPPGGFYVFVADATPIDAARTHVDIYTSAIAQDSLTRAVTGWATGKNLGCPDMGKG
jgi:hypothetical protein